jgi:hypothetical protein
MSATARRLLGGDDGGGGSTPGVGHNNPPEPTIKEEVEAVFKAWRFLGPAALALLLVVILQS